VDQVEEIKTKVDIVQLIGEYVPLKRAGRNFKGLCPFHGEKTPSFMVNPELQIWKCFGCGKGGDCYSFLQQIEGMEFGEALSALATRVGVKLVSYRPSQTEEIRERLIHLNSLAADVYHYLLTKHRLGQPTLAYVKGRGINDTTLAKFNLGYAPANWDTLTTFLVGKKKMPLAEVEQAGLVVSGKKYDRFRDRLMFPINNHRGQTIGFTGRLLPWSTDKMGKYINTPDTQIFHKSEILYGLDAARGEIKSCGVAILVEGQMDVLPNWQADIKNVVAVSGSALTERHVELLRRLCDTVVLALDADFAGDAAARRGIEVAEKAGLIIKVVPPADKYKDPGEWVTADPVGWQQAIAQAIPIYDFYLQSAVKRYGLDVVGKKKMARELLPLWAKIDDEIIKAHYIQKLARTLGVDEDAVRSQLLKTQSSNLKTQNGDQVEDDTMTKSHREVVEEYLVDLALKGKKVTELVKLPIKSKFWFKVVEELKKSQDIAKLPAEMQDRVQGLFLTENEYSDKEWRKAKERLELLEIGEDLTASVDPVQAVKLGRRKGELTKDK